MASIRTRGKYQWQAQVKKIDRATGKIHFESRTFITKSEAENWSRVIEADLARGTYNDTRNAAKTPLRDLIEKYIKEVSPTKKGGEREIGRLRKWLQHEVADRMLTLIHPTDFSAYISMRRNEGRAEQTVKLDIIAISNVFEAARRDWGYNISNPLADISKPGGSRKREMRLLPEDQVRVLAELEKCRNPYFRIITELAIETGMRQGEFFKLRHADVYLDKDPHFVVRDAKDTSGKGGKSRIVPLTPNAVSLIEPIYNSELGKELVFQIGHVTSADGLGRAFTKACTDVGLAGRQFRDLRHEAASRMAKYMNMQTLMKILGHSTSSMVMVYYNPTPEDLQLEIRKMQEEAKTKNLLDDKDPEE